MSIQNLGAVYGPPIPTPRDPEEVPGSGSGKLQETLEQAGSGPRETTAPPTPTPSHLPQEAPPGTDPGLWSVLTAEERAYFAQAAERGPLTYGPNKLGLAEIGLERGGRLDVRA